MKITIQGLDYSAALDAAHPLTIERTLNEPTLCKFWVSLPADGSLATPMRNQAVAVSGDDGTSYFTGYVAFTPIPEYVGIALKGAQYRFAVRAVSDEVLMDQVPAAGIKTASGMTAGQLMKSLITHTRSAALSVPSLQIATPISNFTGVPGAPWSKNARLIAGQARASYRAQGGVLQLSEIPAAVHPLSEAAGTLN